MSVLYRVIKPGGTVYIPTPYKDDHIYEDYTMTSPENREIHFGQDDHVRLYSVKGLKEKLGFKTAIHTFNKQGGNFFFGFKSPEIVLILTK